MNRRLMPLGAGIAAMTLAASAHAELLYEFTFHATVTEKWGDNPDHPWGGVEIGDSAFFQYVIDVEHPDQAPGALNGRYDVQSVVVSYGGIDVQPQIVGPMNIELLLGGTGQRIDIVTRQLWSDNFAEGALFELIGPFGVLPDDSIPIDFDVLDFSIERAIGYGDGTIAFRAVFDSYSYQIIPAPGAAFGLALGVMFRGGRRRRR